MTSKKVVLRVATRKGEGTNRKWYVAARKGVVATRVITITRKGIVVLTCGRGFVYKV